MELSFPMAARAANGHTQDRSYRWLAPDGEILSVAHCRIPMNPNAAEILDRRLGLDAPRLRPKSGGANPDECGTTANPCTLYDVAPTGSYWGYDDDDWWDDGDDCGNGWFSFCDRSGNDYGGGGGGGYDPYDNGCDPYVDPACEKTLTQADKDMIRDAFDTHIRPIDQIVDTNDARAQCKAMYDKFMEMMNANPSLVFRGAYTTKEGDAGAAPHTGAYDQATGHIHFEPDLLDKAATGNPEAWREIANTGMHEAAHALGFDHSESIPSPWGPLYSEDYFNKLDAGEDSCMR